jgi:8-oxo-dGTP diphosphatase
LAPPNIRRELTGYIAAQNQVSRKMYRALSQRLTRKPAGSSTMTVGKTPSRLGNQAGQIGTTRRHPVEAKQVFSTYSGKDGGKVGQFKYCPFCGKELARQDRGGRQRPSCDSCGFVQYRNPVPGVVVLIEKEGCVLLGKRSGGFGQGKWGLPQGYIEFEEDFLTAAIREVKEETGLDVEIRRILNVVSNLLSPRLHTLAIVLLASVVAGELSAGDDLESLEWVPLSGPMPEMAFEADEYIIQRYRNMTINEGLPVDPGFASLGISSAG